uniref:Uncharacterized protein n=1 Tax=Rhizophora mucronata TaxID=61149 RepID=A0A2P2PUM0_RHIMU
MTGSGLRAVVNLLTLFRLCSISRGLFFLHKLISVPKSCGLFTFENGFL